jgi:hypothetical protein
MRVPESDVAGTTPFNVDLEQSTSFIFQLRDSEGIELTYLEEHRPQ